MPRTTPALLTVFALAAACAPPPPDAPAPPAAPGTAARVTAAPAAMGTIESVEYAGTGCEEGTTATGISDDKQAVTSTFSAFVASAGPTEDPELATRTCIIIMRVDVPPGWSYSLESVDYRGFVSLEAGLRASRKSLYVISGSPVHVTPAGRFRGPTTRDYAHHDVSADAPGEWSPCGGGQMLWIATQTDVNNQNEEENGGQLTVDSIDTELQWRRCE